MSVEVNYLAVGAASIASMLVGAVWFGPLLFAKTLVRLRGYSPAEAKRMQNGANKAYAFGLAFLVLMALGLAHGVALVQSYYHYGGVKAGLVTALGVWLVFVMPIQATHILFGNFGEDVEGIKLQLFAINTGAQLLSFVVMGVVIGLIQ